MKKCFLATGSADWTVLADFDGIKRWEILNSLIKNDVCSFILHDSAAGMKRAIS